MKLAAGESAVEPASVEYVYPARFWPSLVWVPVTLLCLMLGLGAAGSDSPAGAAVFLALGVFAASFAFIALRQSVHPRPRLRFDNAGLEWAAGAIHWQDVQRLELYRREGSEGDSHYWAFFRLPSGMARPTDDSHTYFKGWPLLGREPRWRTSGLILPFWKLNPEKPLETLRRFYPGTVGQPRTLERADKRDLKRRGEWPWIW